MDKMTKILHIIKKLSSVSIVIFVVSCAGQKKIRELAATEVNAVVGMISQKEESPLAGYGTDTSKNHVFWGTSAEEQERVTVRDSRDNRIIMNAVKDEQSGEMIAADVLNEIVVEAPFRNVAERNGEVEIAFEIRVPQQMQDPQWQVRFQPCFYLAGDTLYSEQVHITGAKYRAAQLKGYELYKKYLASIIPDSCDFIDAFCYENLMNIFIDRKFKKGGEWESDTIVRQEIVDYYTKHWLVAWNHRKKMKKESMFKRYVKSPFITEGVRLDSVITNPDGTLKYCYVQTIRAVKGLRRVEMTLSGGIFTQERQIYVMPDTAPLTFYISSVSAFTDTTVRYVKTIVARNLNINTAAYIDFKAGDYSVNDTLSDNAREIERIKGNIRDVLANEEYVVDSLMITASCSPEGTFSSNVRLAANRARAIKNYFTAYISRHADRENCDLWNIDVSGGGNAATGAKELPGKNGKIPQMITTWIPEEWGRLENLIKTDTNIHDKAFLERCFLIADVDVREKSMQACSDYQYIRRVLYPYLRTVKFDFFLHRKGMIKDTVHTTEVDTLYMSGLQALKERDYKLAIEKLRPYQDYNAAVAYVCLDYNQSALSILENLQKSAKRDYMLALVYSRLGDERKAVGFYLHACEQDPSLRFRGNLDPEISGLIKRYSINQEW